MTYLQNLQSNTQIFLNDKKDVFLHYPKYDQKCHILFRVISGTNPSVGHSEGSLVFILYLLIATVITYGLIKHMTPGFFFTMLMIFCFTLFVIDWITLFNPFSFCHRYFVFLTFLTLNLFCFDNRWNWYRFTNLKKHSFCYLKISTTVNINTQKIALWGNVFIMTFLKFQTFSNSYVTIFMMVQLHT